MLVSSCPERIHITQKKPKTTSLFLSRWPLHRRNGSWTALNGVFPTIFYIWYLHYVLSPQVWFSKSTQKKWLISITLVTSLVYDWWPACTVQMDQQEFELIKRVESSCSSVLSSRVINKKKERERERARDRGTEWWNLTGQVLPSWLLEKEQKCYWGSSNGNA